MFLVRLVVWLLVFYWLMDSIAGWKDERDFKKLHKEIEEREANNKRKKKKKYSTPPEFRGWELMH